jgi:hypothetical protein
MPFTKDEQETVRSAVLGVKAMCRRYDVSYFAVMDIEKFLKKIEHVLEDNKIDQKNKTNEIS